MLPFSLDNTASGNGAVNLNVLCPGRTEGAEIADPKGILKGTGKFMRHVKLGSGRD